MLANFLEKSKPINFVVYLGVFFIFFLVEIYTAFFNDSFLIENVLQTTVYFFLFLLIFFFFNFIVAKNNLTFDNTFAYFLGTLFIIVFVKEILDYKSLFSIVLYFLFLRKTYSLQKNSKVLQKLFDAGLWLGVLVILQPNCALFLLLIYISVLVYRTINIQTILVPLLGVFVPIFLYISYCFWLDKTGGFLSKFNEDLFYFKFNFSQENGWFIAFISSLSIVAFLLKTPKALSVSNTFKMSWILINFNYLLAFVLIVTGDSSKELSTLFLLFPASIVIANGIELISKKSIQSLIFGAIILTTILGWWFL